MTSRRTVVLLGFALVLLTASGVLAAPLQYFTVSPCRIADTNDPVGPTGGPALAANTARHFPVYGANARPCGLPQTTGQVKAVVVNLTIVGPTSAGNLIVYKYGLPTPLTSNLNFIAGETALGNGALVELAADANQQITVWPAMAAGATARLVIDITGYYE